MKTKHTYRITEDGRVFSVSSNWRGYGEREMKQTLNSDGYPSVRIIHNGKRKRFATHILVAYEFLGPRPKGLQIRHLDGNKMNCHKNNLCYGTALENASDRDKHGKTSKGLTHSIKIKAGIYDKN
jgi:hypothetical protein